MGGLGAEKVGVEKGDETELHGEGTRSDTCSGRGGGKTDSVVTLSVCAPRACSSHRAR